MDSTAAGGKRVLVIDVTLPRPDRDSGSVRMVNLLRTMRGLGHSVDFVPDDRATTASYVNPLQVHGVRVHTGPDIGNYPDWFARKADDYDIVVVCRYHLGEFLIPLLRKTMPNALLILDTVDLHHLREEREASLHGDRTLARLAKATRNRELAAIRLADVAWVVSAFEKEYLDRLEPNGRVLVLPNIVEAEEDPAGFGERSDLIFLGGALHPPNVDAVRWLLRDIYPEVRRQLPDCSLHVVGAGFPGALADSDIPDGVQIHGHLPDIRPLLDHCRVGLAPLRFGAGVKGKINTCLAAGIPVVATSCAVEGMHLHDEENVLVADSPEDFSSAIVRLYTTDVLWSALSVAGQQAIIENFSPHVARAAIIETFAPQG